MIRKLQKKFISITAAALFVVILSVMAAINGIFFYQTNQMLDSRLAQLMASQTSHHLPWQPRPPGQSPSPGRDGILPSFEDRLDIRPDGCLVILSENGGIKEIRQDGSGRYSSAELSGLITEISEGDREHGWYQYYKFRKGTFPSDDGTPQTVIGLLNASSSLYSVFSMLLISTVIGSSCFLLVLLMIILASGRAVKPVAESYLRQKQFVTDAGHELKTPLTVISADNELLRLLYGESEWSDSIDRQVSKMNTLVQNLITLAKMDEEQDPVFSSFSLSDAVFDTASSFENLILSRNQRLTLDIPEGIRCTGDESRLRQLVSILMDNASKYCDAEGGISVRLRSDRQLRLQVANDCHDAEECDFDRVFERFYRADRARASDGSYGLGLSIAKSITELHRGEIRASAAGHRVMFEVILPRKSQPGKLRKP